MINRWNLRFLPTVHDPKRLISCYVVWNRYPNIVNRGLPMIYLKLTSCRPGMVERKLNFRTVQENRIILMPAIPEVIETPFVKLNTFGKYIGSFSVKHWCHVCLSTQIWKEYEWLFFVQNGGNVNFLYMSYLDQIRLQEIFKMMAFELALNSIPNISGK